jgi:hypothetical protein
LKARDTSSIITIIIIQQVLIPRRSIPIHVPPYVE